VKPSAVEAQASEAGHDEDQEDHESLHFEFLLDESTDSASLKHADDQDHERDDQENVD
jgi:hypothetical protein